jgi:hypothetical protein
LGVDHVLDGFGAHRDERVTDLGAGAGKASVDEELAVPTR